MKVATRTMRVLRHVDRNVTLLTRKTVNQAESFTRLRNAIQEAARRHFGASMQV